MNFDTKADLEPVSAHFDRQEARYLLAAAVKDGLPLRPEIRAGLTRLLDVLALSESRSWNPDAVEAPEGGQQREANKWHAAAWRNQVGVYRELLAEVRANGVTADKAVS